MFASNRQGLLPGVHVPEENATIIRSGGNEATVRGNRDASYYVGVPCNCRDRLYCLHIPDHNRSASTIGGNPATVGRKSNGRHNFGSI
jgi:hypothetical protein